MTRNLEAGKTLPVIVDCPDCNGRGFHSNERGTEWDCEQCGGAGWYDAADDQAVPFEATP